ncbi:Histone-lysine N-methyltransferase SETMAR [Vespula squamosa]|uniref:Histone-lysine N-methyltransferase SETMAR n=1 Tax=Vespula squamosa TaxID=30214 RepID=A0ABD2A184_VESSQ
MSLAMLVISFQRNSTSPNDDLSEGSDDVSILKCLPIFYTMNRIQLISHKLIGERGFFLKNFFEEASGARKVLSCSKIVLSWFIYETLFVKHCGHYFQSLSSCRRIHFVCFEVLYTSFHTPTMENQRKHLRHVTLHCFQKGNNAKDTAAQICTICESGATSVQTRFGTGNFNMKDEERNGYPSNMVDKNPRYIICELADILNILRITIHNNLTKIGYFNRSEI